MKSPNTVSKQVRTCNVCDSASLEELMSLPSFPFTGVFCSAKDSLPSFIEKGVDQGLMLCNNCGHAQLKYVVNPALVYDETYTHRGSLSPIATQGNLFLRDFLLSTFPKEHFETIVDIGCNDGYLLRQVEPYANQLIGIDPIWSEKGHHLSDKIDLYGGFAENFDYRNYLKSESCLIISAHTFEHIESPKYVLEKILAQAPASAKIIIEVPSFDTLVQNNRFDQVFHQHIQYYSLASFLKLIEELNCTYLAHKFNYSMWGGTMMFAFKNTPTPKQPISFSKFTTEDVLTSWNQFKSSLFNLSSFIERYSNKEKFYAYGAAQMVPSLVYHIPNHLSVVKNILDDSPARQGLTYPRFPFSIHSPEDFDFQDTNIVITALDSIRPILRRLVDKKAKRILIPAQII